MRQVFEGLDRRLIKQVFEGQHGLGGN
jgi:hypothetical protein